MPQIGSLFVNLSMNTAQFTQQSTAAANQLNNITGNSRKLQFALTNLGFQINDVVSGFATGQDPMRIFAQQAGQIVQLFTQGGGFRQVMGGAATAIRNFITPTTAAVGSVAALAAGIALLVSRATESQARVRSFDLVLRGLGTQGQATAANLEEAAKRLREVGLDANEARDAMLAAQRAGIAPGQAERIVRIGQNLIPVLGDKAQEQFIGAIKGGVDALGDLGRQLGVVSEREIEAAREAEKFGRQVAILNDWVTRIEARVKGFNDQALSPVGRSLRELRIQFSALLDAMANSKFIQFFVDRLKDIADTLTAIFNLRPPNWFNRLIGQGGEFTGPPIAEAPIPPAPTGGAGGGGAARLGPRDDPRGKEAMIRYWASYYGHDPDIAVRVAQSEGLRTYVGDRGKSFGAFQLYTGGGLGNVFQRETGLDPADPRNEDRMIQWSMARLRVTGWGPYHGAARVGIGLHQGIATGGGGAGGVSPNVLAQPERAADAFTARIEQEFDYQRRQTEAEINAERIRAGGFAGFGGPGGLTRAGFAAQAAMEAQARFGFTDLSGNQLAQQQIAGRRAQLEELNRARTITGFAEQNARDRQRVEQLQLETDLQGKSAEQIERQVELLKVRQEAERAGLDLSSEAVQNRLKEVAALSDANIQLAQRKEMLAEIREIAGVFQNAFSQAFDGIVNGTFKLRQAIGSLLRDIGKTLANQAFKRLFEGGAGGEGGILGGLFGRLFGIGGTSSGGGDFGGVAGGNPYAGGGYFGSGAFQTGGSFRVGGYGALDSQLVAFRASPGEMVTVNPQGGPYGGGHEVVRVELNPSEGWVAGVADQRILTRSGTIIDVAVRQSQKVTRQNFASMTAETQARQM